MAFTVTLVAFAGAIALLLWGTHMVQTGVQRAFGGGLRTFLGRTLRHRFAAFLSGLGVTALLQSSTATGLMVAGFSAGGLVDLVPALSVMLGANVGTTFIVQVLSFDVAALSPALILVGVFLFRRDTSTRTHDLSRVFIGLGLMLLALQQVLGLLAGYEHAPGLRHFIDLVGDTPLLAVLAAAALTWAAHSSVAVVLLVMSLADQGAVPLDTALALVLGANLGTAINPVVEGPSGNDPAARRLPVGNLLTRLVGVVVALPLLDHITPALLALEADPGRVVADAHTLFNLVLAAVFLPLLVPYAHLLALWLPRRIDPADPSRPHYLDPAAKETPVVALGGAAREALRLADILADMLDGARDYIASGDRRLFAETRRRDDVLDSLNTAIGDYLLSLDPDELAEADQRRLQQILAFSMNMEQAGDVIDRILLPHASKARKRGLVLPREDAEGVAAMIGRLETNLRTAASLFMTEDARAARMLAEEKVAFRASESAALAEHFSRGGGGDDAMVSAFHLDLVRDLKLLNSHIVASSAYPVLANSGELLPSRLTGD